MLTTTTTTLAASATSLEYGSSITLTATVSTTAATGTIAFLSGTESLGSATASLGVATLTTKALPAGAGELTATYIGDSTYAGSSSGAIAVTVTD